MNKTPYIIMTALTALCVPLAACGMTEKPVPCPVCYEDEWSREPFPGQAKQHIKPLTPEDIQRNGGVTPMAPTPAR